MPLVKFQVGGASLQRLSKSADNHADNEDRSVVCRRIGGGSWSNLVEILHGLQHDEWTILRGRWIDIDKGDDDNLIMWSRLVGKEFNIGPMDDLFAATPPLEALRALIGEAVACENNKEDKAVAFSNVIRAFFESPATRMSV